jgi:Fur family transcriptional regulator, ferric uptake regulator
MAQLATDFATQLHAQGYRLTPQRQLILAAMQQANDHVTPDDVYARVHRRNPAISRATIYRTLDFLCEMRLIHALYWGGRMYYEITDDQPHHHLICRACGAIDQIDHILLNDLFQVIEDKHRFTIDMDHVALFGVCSHCRNNRKKSRK